MLDFSASDARMPNRETEQLVATVFRHFQHQSKHARGYEDGRKLAEALLKRQREGLSPDDFYSRYSNVPWPEQKP